MKVAIYSPYLDSFGGGERYMLTIAELLSSGNQVDVLLDRHLKVLIDENVKNDLGKRFNLDLSRVKLVRAPLGRGEGFLSKFFFLRKYDLVFYLTDGSIFYSSAKKNIIHFQVPFKNTVAKSLWGRIKLFSWNLAICNSRFTQSVVEKDWSIKSQVMYPPVDVEVIKPLNKKKQILSVGRFASFSKLKKHEIMIQAFKELCQEKKISGWSLHLVGSVEGDQIYIDELKELARGLPIKFYPNLSFSGLVKLYGESSIYWHAAGFGEDNPTLMEHFGIATVEAMAGGCVPIVINSGGQIEIVENEISGFLWNQINELKDLTATLTKDNSLLVKLSANAVKRSKMFSKKFFQDNIIKLVKLLDE